MATYTPIRFGTGAGGVTPVQLTTSATIIHTVPASTKDLIKHILVTNVSGSDATFTLYLVKVGGTAGATNAIFSALTVPAGKTLDLSMAQALDTAGDFLSALASVNSAINITISGIRQT